MECTAGEKVVERGDVSRRAKDSITFTNQQMEYSLLKGAVVEALILSLEEYNRGEKTGC